MDKKVVTLIKFGLDIITVVSCVSILTKINSLSLAFLSTLLLLAFNTLANYIIKIIE